MCPQPLADFQDGGILSVLQNAQPPPKSAKRPAAAEAKTPGSQKKAKVEAATPKTPAGESGRLDWQPQRKVPLDNSR